MPESNRLRNLTTRSPDETEEVGRLLGERLGRGAYVGLSGDLGGGKTTLTRGIARGLGITDAVTSPTFQLIREYDGRARLFHFDFYRLASPADLLDLDLNDCLRTGIVVAEWAEKFEAPGAESFLSIRLDWAGDTRRRITFTGWSPDFEPVLASLKKELERYTGDEDN